MRPSNIQRAGVLFCACAAMSVAVCAGEPSVAWSRTLMAAQHAPTDGVASIIIALKDAAAQRMICAAPWSQVEKVRPLFPVAARRTKASAPLDALCVARLAPGGDLQAALAELQTSPLVAYAEPNHRMKLMAMPNDTLYNNQWALHNIGQPYVAVVGGAQTQAQGTPDCDIDWQEASSVSAWTNEVIVAVIDSGVDYMHSELTNQMWRNPLEIPNNHIDDDGNGYVDDVCGVDFHNDDGDPMDDHGHGTHCAGIIAAQTHNGDGIAGVCPSARIMALKIGGSDGYVCTDKAIMAVRYAAEHGARVANNSWSSPAFSQALQAAIDYATGAGCLVIAAAGNDNTDNATYPAAQQNVFATAATDANDQKASFSNYGLWVDVAAPGMNILSLRARNTDMYAGLGEPAVHIVSNRFYLSSGTSMASPVAAGAAAALMSSAPGHAAWVYARLLQQSADSLDAGNPSYVGRLGSGRINLGRALSFTNDAVLLDAQMMLKHVGGYNYLVPNETTNVRIALATWSRPMTDVAVVVSNLTPGFVCNTDRVWVGDLAAFYVTNLSESSVTVTAGTERYQANRQLLVQVFAGTNLVDQQILVVDIYAGYATFLAVDDLDGDGAKEIASTYFNMVHVFAADGRLRWAYEAPLGVAPFGGCAVGDIDGDGVKEIVAGQEPSLYPGPALYAFEPDGAFTPGWPRTDADAYLPPALSDVDEDGVLDVVVAVRAASGAELRAYHGDGTLLWTHPAAGYQLTPPSIGDLDHDGWNEIVVMAYNASTYDNRILMIRHDGGAFGAAIPAGGRYNNEAVALGDMDNDGDLELLAMGTRRLPNNTWENAVVAFHHTGVALAGWPKLVTNSWCGTRRIPRLADLDADGDLELVFGAWGAGLYAWHHTGAAVAGFPIADAFVANQPWLADITGDAQPEILYCYNPDPAYARYGTILGARKLDGSNVPGYPLTLNPTNGIDDLCVCNLGTDTNQHILVAGGGIWQGAYTELYTIDTGARANDLPRAWPATRHDAQQTAWCGRFATSPFVASFHADHTVAINTMDALLSTYVQGDHTNGLYYLWDFNGDGTVDAQGAHLAVTNHGYGLGTHTVGLTVSNDLGEAYTRVRPNYLQVIPPVTCDFTANVRTGAAPLTVQFTSSTANQPQHWRWDLNGDGAIDSTNINPTYQYAATGLFTVSLLVSNNFGIGGASHTTVTKSQFVVISTTGYAGVHYVATNGAHLAPFKTWAEAATNIQAAIDVAAPGELVLVTNGVYVSATPLFISNVTVCSVNGPGRTVIQGTYENNCVRMVQRGARLEGFTVRYGKAGSIYPGAGINCGVGGSVSNCVITQNGYGFLQNGGGIYCNHYCTVSDCVIVSNNGYNGGGIFITSYDTVQTCRISYNYADGSGAGAFLDGGLMRNCLLTDNSGLDSALFVREYDEIGTVRNCTVARNTVRGVGGAINCLFDARIYNTISYFNTGGNFTNRETGATYWFCCMTPMPKTPYHGAGTITVDPAFMNTSANDFHLKAMSLCVNGGENAYVSSTHDLDHVARMIDGKVDMGCYERPTALSLSAPSIVVPTNVPSGKTGRVTILDDNTDIAMAGAKMSGALVYMENLDSWTAMQQTLAGVVWSNQVHPTSPRAYTNRFKVTTSDFANASSNVTTLILTVLPEPMTCSGWSLLGMLWLCRRVQRTANSCTMN